jgi:hypothetical protein
MSEDDEEELGDEEAAESDQLHTVCHLCGGVGSLANPVLAVIGGVPRTVDARRPCPLCGDSGALPGLVPPV